MPRGRGSSRRQNIVLNTPGGASTIMRGSRFGIFRRAFGDRTTMRWRGESVAAEVDAAGRVVRERKLNGRIALRGGEDARAVHLDNRARVADHEDVRRGVPDE